MEAAQPVQLDGGAGNRNVGPCSGVILYRVSRQAFRRGFRVVPWTERARKEGESMKMAVFSASFVRLAEREHL